MLPELELLFPVTRQDLVVWSMTYSNRGHEWLEDVSRYQDQHPAINTQRNVIVFEWLLALGQHIPEAIILKERYTNTGLAYVTVAGVRFVCSSVYLQQLRARLNS